MARRWFQFHLATIVALMLVASMLLGLNVLKHVNEPMNGVDYGFPFPMYQNWKPPETIQDVPSVRFAHSFAVTIYGVEFSYNNHGWSYSLAAINAAAWVVILAVTAFCMEKFMRLRQR
jgi:hypothetical protein